MKYEYQSEKGKKYIFNGSSWVYVKDKPVRMSQSTVFLSEEGHDMWYEDLRNKQISPQEFFR